MKSQAQTDLPRGLRFPVPLDKGNEGSGDEIAVLLSGYVCSYINTNDLFSIKLETEWFDFFFQNAVRESIM